MHTKLIGCLCIAALALSAQAANPAKVKLSPEEKMLLELTNAERKKMDLEPLQPNPVLFQVARGHSQNMAKQGKMAHQLDGKGIVDRVKDAGYKYSSVGENVARMSSTIGLETLMKGWMGSKIHRENILNPAVNEIGLGIVTDKSGVVYYTQVFGKQR